MTFRKLLVVGLSLLPSLALAGGFALPNTNPRDLSLAASAVASSYAVHPANSAAHRLSLPASGPGADASAGTACASGAALAASAGSGTALSGPLTSPASASTITAEPSTTRAATCGCGVGHLSQSINHLPEFVVLPKM